MKHLLGVFILSLFIFTASAQKKSKLISGMYLQWGYNTEWYSKSTIHFNTVVNGVVHDFTIYKAKAHNRADLSAITKNPIQFTIPQYNYRIGFYLNKNHTRAIEINYDHTKYIVYDNQPLRAKGKIGSDYFDKDTSFASNEVHFEHTNGANFYQINYVQQYELKRNAKRPVFTALWKAGAGILIPKTDITLSNKRVDNRFHIAGYCFGAEAGARWYVSRKLFFEGTAKAGFANYTNALGVGNGKVNHHFAYFELIGTIGYDINF
ncbi:MAG: hypothetical protein ABIW15_02975 [Ferruginibacter sp.]